MKNKKKTLSIGLLVTGILVVSALALNIIISNKIEGRINKMLGSEAAYKTLDVDLLQRRVELKNLNYHKNGRKIVAEEVVLKGIGFYTYLMKDRLEIGEVILRHPEVTVSQKEKSPKDSVQTFERDITISKFKTVDGVFRFQNQDSVGNAMFLRIPELEISNIKIDSATVKEKIPFKYESYSLVSDSVRINLNPEHFVAASHFKIKNGRTSVKNFRIIPYYDKDKFNEVVPFEKDRISLKTDEITLDSLQFYFKEGMLFLRNPNMTVTGANLQIYRNKELPDDPSGRPLYSQMLREAPVKLDFEKVKVKNSKIEYEERVQADRPTAKIGFYEINADVENIINIGLDRKDFPRTKVTANANFQQESPVNIEWSFNTTNPEDKFLISGNFGKIPAEALNPLMRPSMNMEVEGAINEAYFTFTGNEDFLIGDVRLNYDQFRIVLLEENGNKKKGFLSAVANLFVDNDGVSEENSAQQIQVQRDKQKSFWNFVWQGLRKGMAETLKQL